MLRVEFKAPWSRSLRKSTALSTAILCAICAVGLLVSSGSPLLRYTLAMLPFAVVLAASLFVVRGYVLTDDAIEVTRLGWTTALPLTTLQSVEGNTEAMRGSLCVFANGGLFACTGIFWNRRLGLHRAFATDRSRAVVLRYPRRTVVLTPHDPQHFIVRVRTLLKIAQFPK